MHNQLAYKMRIHIKDCACIPNLLFIILKIISILSRRSFVPGTFRQSIRLLLSSKDETHLKSFMVTEKSFVDIGANVDVHTLSMAKKGVDFYGGEEVKRPLAWWIVSPLGYSYSEYFKQYKLKAYPKEGLIEIYLVPKMSTKNVAEGMKPYCDWIKSCTGLMAKVVLVDDIPKGHKLLEVIK